MESRLQSGKAGGQFIPMPPRANPTSHQNPRPTFSQPPRPNGQIAGVSLHNFPRPIRAAIPGPMPPARGPPGFSRPGPFACNNPPIPDPLPPPGGPPPRPCQLSNPQPNSSAWQPGFRFQAPGQLPGSQVLGLDRPQESSVWQPKVNFQAPWTLPGSQALGSHLPQDTIPAFQVQAESQHQLSWSSPLPPTLSGSYSPVRLFLIL